MTETGGQSSMAGMEQVIQEFLAESFEGLDHLEQDFVTLESDPSDRTVFERIFRTVHTIKGTCGFLAFGKLEEIAHAGENVLSLLRDGKVEVRPEITTILLSLMDALRSMLVSIRDTGAEETSDYSELVTALAAIEREAAAGPGEEKKSPDLSPASEPPAEPVRRPAKVLLDEDSPPAAPASPPASTEHSDVPLPSLVTDSTIRVDVGVLDHLMNLVGELVLARNQILQHTSDGGDIALSGSAQRLNSITSELQEAVMKTRMQPVSSVWSKLPRYVRDLALRCGKEVRLEMQGQDTELDKTVIEAMKGSLLHLVRNAVDHGIETPAEREGKGKPRSGRLALRASHEGGYVMIEVSDDGAGLDRERILDRALRQHVVTPERAKRLSERELLELLFHPGFSTAANVTAVSGRGVGLDVVRNSVEAIGGSVEVQTEPGLSTTVRMKIPLTLAIIPVLIVTARGQRFAIPQTSVVELVRLDRERAALGIERIHGVPVYRLRGKLLPLVSLASELTLDDGAPVEDRQSRANIVVLHGDDRQFGLVVDSVDDSQEIVVKAPGPLLAGLPYGGATILGDGRVALILDIFRLGLAAGVVSEDHERLAAEAAGERAAPPEKVSSLLYLQGPDDERMVIHFPLVSRLELVPRDRVETVGGQEVIQYRGDILPLIDLTRALPERRQRPRNRSPEEERNGFQVVVCAVEGRKIGLVVHRILDIVEHSLKGKRPASRPGVEACIVVRDRVTEVVDVPALIRRADPEFFDRAVEGE